MFVHEYSDKEFATYEECREDLLPEIDEDRLTELLHGDFSAHEVHRAPYFLRKDEKK